MMRLNVVGTSQLGRFCGLLIMVDVCSISQHIQMCGATIGACDGILVTPTLTCCDVSVREHHRLYFVKKSPHFERVGTHRPPANRDTWPQKPRLGSWAMGAQTARAHSPHVPWRETLNFTSKLSCSPQEVSALAVTARLQLRRRTTIAADGWWSVGLVVRKVG